MRTLVVFEDVGWHAFAPLVGVRAVFDLRCGARTLLERMLAAVQPGHLGWVARPELGALLAESHRDMTAGELALLGDAVFPRDDVTFVNGRLLALGRDLPRLLDGPKSPFVASMGAAVVAGRCPAPQAARLAAMLGADLAAAPRGASPADLQALLARDLPDLVRLELTPDDGWNRDGSVLLEHVWQLVEHNGAALRDDFLRAGGGAIAPTARLDAGVHILQPDAVRIESDVRLRPGVVLDAEEGPILLGAGTDVQPHVVIRGPASIGPHCVLKAGTKVHGDTSLGPVCKVGGEVAETIVQGYSNKQHEGFLGHAFLAEWVNLGADTNNSDLKNNYGSVRVWESGSYVDTGLLFAGLVAADHVRSAINTQFNTGTVVDVCSQIAMLGFPPKYVPPFSWCGPEGIAVYDIERAVQTARTVMARRDVTMSPAYEAALRRIFTARDDG